MHVIVHDMNKCRNLHKSLVIDHPPQLDRSISLQTQGCRRTKLKSFPSIPDTQILTNKWVFFFSLANLLNKRWKAHIDFLSNCWLVLFFNYWWFPIFLTVQTNAFFTLSCIKLNPSSTSTPQTARHRRLSATFNYWGLKDCTRKFWNIHKVFVECAMKDSWDLEHVKDYE